MTHWSDHAACRSRPDLAAVWVGDDQEPSTVFEAKCVCWSCPVIDACADNLLPDEFERAYAAGVIAGTSEQDRHGRKGRPRKPRTPITCGTRAGYHRHRKQGEDACEACRGANAEYSRVWKATG